MLYFCIRLHHLPEPTWFHIGISQLQPGCVGKTAKRLAANVGDGVMGSTEEWVKVDLKLQFTNLPAFLAARFWFISSCLCVDNECNWTKHEFNWTVKLPEFGTTTAMYLLKKNSFDLARKLPSPLSVLKPMPLDHGAAPAMESLDDIDEELIELLSCHRPATCRHHGKSQWIMLCIFFETCQILDLCDNAFCTNLRLPWGPMHGNTNERNDWVSVSGILWSHHTPSPNMYKLSVSPRTMYQWNLWGGMMPIFVIVIWLDFPDPKMSLERLKLTLESLWSSLSQELRLVGS